MKKLVLVSLVAMAALALVFTAGPAQAAGEYLFKYSNSQSDTHPRSVSMFYFKDLVESASGGRKEQRGQESPFSSPWKGFCCAPGAD